MNYFDVDVLEVVNVMKIIVKFNGRVFKVLLLKRIIDVLLKLVCCNFFKIIYDDFFKRYKIFKFVSFVKERFVLKLMFKKISKNNY